MISRPTAIGIVGVIVVIIALILNHEDKRESEKPLKNKTSVAKNQLSQNGKTDKKVWKTHRCKGKGTPARPPRVLAYMSGYMLMFRI